LDNPNIVTLVLAALFLGPILIGFFRPFSREKVQYSLGSLLDNIEFLAGIILSIYLTKRIFFENDSEIFRQIYGLIPESVKSMLYGQDILTYIVVVPILLLLVLLIFRLVTTPLYHAVIVPLSNRTYASICSMNSALRRTVGALWELPKSLYLPILAALILNFYTYYIYSPVLSKWMNESQVYMLIYDRALYPVLNSNIAKQIPVIVNDSFRNAIGKVINKQEGLITDQLAGRNIRVIEYFNGVTLEEAIKSNDKIDETAVKIVGEEKNSKRKAYAIYRWISKNLDYDFDKAEKISRDPMGISSGSIVAFETRKGICFDYSCLYISMCRAVGLKVRMITGLAYSGTMWGDHAWNQVYSEEEERWINVDATFGSSGTNYFDGKNFQVDHQYAVVQGEW